MYDYLVVGAGLFGAVFAHEAALKGKKVKVIEKRNHIAGNIYTREEEGIQVHQYGAHIFHISDKEIWDWEKGDDPYYPVNNDRNNHLYKSYKKWLMSKGMLSLVAVQDTIVITICTKLLEQLCSV